MNQNICLIEVKLRGEYRDAVESRKGRTPAESPERLVALNTHRRLCYACKGGYMGALYVEFFAILGVPVEVAA